MESTGVLPSDFGLSRVAGADPGQGAMGLGPRACAANTDLSPYYRSPTTLYFSPHQQCSKPFSHAKLRDTLGKLIVRKLTAPSVFRDAIPKITNAATSAAFEVQVAKKPLTSKPSKHRIDRFP